MTDNWSWRTVAIDGNGSGAVGVRFFFSDHMFRSRRTHANFFQIRHHELVLSIVAANGIEATSRLVLSSWNFQSFPGPDFYPPRLSYSVEQADGRLIQLRLYNELNFEGYTTTEAQACMRETVAFDVSHVERACWSADPYDGHAQSFRFKRVAG